MDPDTLATACHILADEWGSYGYRVDAIEPTGAGAGALSIHHYDGSHFALAVDRWGCHHGTEPHDGTEYHMFRAMIAAADAARAAHAAADKARALAVSAE